MMILAEMLKTIDILAEMLKISKNWRGSLLVHYHYNRMFGFINFFSFRLHWLSQVRPGHAGSGWVRQGQSWSVLVKLARLAQVWANLYQVGSGLIYLDQADPD